MTARQQLIAAELVLAQKQDLIDAIDLVLYELREYPGLHGCLPSLRSMTADMARRIAEGIAQLKARTENT